MTKAIQVHTCLCREAVYTINRQHTKITTSLPAASYGKSESRYRGYERITITVYSHVSLL